MKTLSVKQPWAYLLCAGIKDVENRTWKLPEKYKGKWVLIHASANMSCPDKYSDDVFTLFAPLLFAEYERSAIIGAVKFSECIINSNSIWAEKTAMKWVRQNGYIDEIDKPIYNWVVSDSIFFKKPILGVRGKLSFWDYDLPEEYQKLLQP